MNYARLKVPAVVGLRSATITSGSPPHARGGYFYLEESGSRVLNFWAENLEAADNSFLDDHMVEILRWKGVEDEQVYDVCIVDDRRIPPDWYFNTLCFTGTKRPPMHVAQEIYAILGDPGNEMEYYTDIEMYHAKRNQRYFSGGTFSFSGKTTSEQLVAELLNKRAAK